MLSFIVELKGEGPRLSELGLYIAGQPVKLWSLLVAVNLKHQQMLIYLLVRFPHKQQHNNNNATASIYASWCIYCHGCSATSKTSLYIVWKGAVAPLKASTKHRAHACSVYKKFAVKNQFDEHSIPQVWHEALQVIETWSSITSTATTGATTPGYMYNCNTHMHQVHP